MDHRDTEDFARRMEAAELRAQALRHEAVEALWNAAAAGLRRAFAALRRAGPHGRSDPALPEA
jgi:hypothetical protein